ncbi:dethiobiotin synthase [Prauserella halophila]|uniref:dethiobiotin synthase n=1 Tax=Prauserella halophila TaxID=185641 RepID=UPI0020A56766|nr:dethiobiotin synthase [Prauserella halophila]MCP2237386.1 dethiobiotin synthetase [Prauserella halophila]
MITIVTGTDTGVGKTVATAALAVRCGPGTLVVKPAQTGAGTDEPDCSVVRRLAAREVTEFVRLDDPLAPGTAARLHGLDLPAVQAHAARIRELARRHRRVIVEGSGGLLVRLDTGGGTLTDLAADLVRDHDVEVLVVTRIALGTLNHTELTVDALRARGIEPAGLVLGAVPEQSGLAAQCNRTELPRITGVPVVAALPEGAGALDPEQFRARAVSWFAAWFAASPDGRRNAGPRHAADDR